MDSIARKAWADRLGISTAAIDLYLSTDVIDLHVDTYIWARMFGYDITKRHGTGPFGARLMGQADLPRLREAQVTGAMWSVTTQPFLPAARRARNLVQNFREIRRVFESVPGEARICRNFAEYESARAAGVHAVFLVIQGGNACGPDLAAIDEIAGDLLRVTLVHLSTSSLGCTSAPSPAGLAGGARVKGLTDFGREYVRRLNAGRIFVDLAHISREGFFDAVAVHDRTQPLIVTHTGVNGVHPHWRNLDDEQIRAIADTGGTIGVMYQSSFLGPSILRGRAEWVVQHLEHVVRVGGEACGSLGSDWDGMIVPPVDLPTCLELPRLVQIMLDRGWPETRVRAVLGGNFLRSLRELRPS
jgi:membrane dipeptidase